MERLLAMPPPIVLAEAAAAAAAQANGSPSVAAAALVAGAVALVVLAAMIVSWLLSAAARRETNHPRRLLVELCQAHGFARRQQRVLLAAAGVLGVDQPARFFLESRLLSAAASHPRLKGKRQELLEIAAELFESVRLG